MEHGPSFLTRGKSAAPRPEPARESDGWLSLQGAHGTARLVRAVLSPDSFALYALKPAARAAAAAPATARSSPYATPASSPRAITHRSVDAPHPDYADRTAVSSEAVAHRLLFEPPGLAPLSDPHAFVLCAPVPEVAASMEQYLDLLVAKNLAGPFDPAELFPRVAANVAKYCVAVTDFPAVVFNVAALAAVLRLVSGLGMLDAQLAEQLKVSIAKAQDAAQKQLQLALTPADSSTAAPASNAPPSSSGHANSAGNSTDHPSSTGHPSSAGHPSTKGNSSNPTDTASPSPLTPDAPASGTSFSAFAPTPSPPVSRSPWAPKILRLAQTSHGLPTSLMLEPGFAEEFADQLAAFHRRMWRLWSPLIDPSLLFHTPHSSAAWRGNPLVADRSQPHFLSLLVAQHVLSGALPLEARAKLVDKWICVATALRRQGDGVGWIAIVATLFQTAILRLDKVWDMVTAIVPPPTGGADSVADWGHELFELNKRANLPFLEKRALRVGMQHTGKAFAKEDSVPYFGDAILTDGPRGDVELTQKQLHRVNVVVAGWQDYLKTVANETAPVGTAEDPAYQCLFAVWAQHPTLKIDMATLSLATQPKLLGHYFPHFYNQPLPLPAGGMLPVLFTSASPNFRLFPLNTLMLASIPKTSSSHHTAGHSGHGGGRPGNGRLLRRSSSFPPAGPPMTTGFTELDLGAREQLEHTASAHVLAKSVRDLLNVGTDTIDGDADIVFKSFIGDDNFQRSSRTSSIIENLNLSHRRQSYMASQPLPEQAGQASPLVSQPQQYAASPQSPFRTKYREVVIKSASMVRLVDALVLDASVFGRKDLKLDLDAHISTLLATFRSFCAPAQLLDMLQLRVRCARGAARMFSSAIAAGNSPASLLAGNRLWQPSSPEDPIDATAIRIVSAVISTMEQWISEYYFDFMDDEFVMKNGMALIMALRSELAPSEDRAYSYPEAVAMQNRRMTKCFLRQQYSIVTHKFAPEPAWLAQLNANAHSAQPLPFTPELPVTNLEADQGISVINTMVDELDTLVSDAFSRIRMVDWMKLFEVLEQQTGSPTGLYSYRTSPLTSESDVVIQDVYSWLRTLHDPASKTRVLDKLPEPIVALVRLHAGIVSYFSAQVADPTLTHGHERVERMAFLLKMIGVLRARMQYLNLCASVNEGGEKDQNLPSFLEQALTSAILLPESRAYSAAWLAAGKAVAHSFPGNANNGGSTASDALPNQRNLFVPTIAVKQGKPVTICVGWIIERLLEIVCCVPNLSVDHPDLINFDKRRYAYNLIKNMGYDTSQYSPVSTPPELAAKYAHVLGEPARNISVNIPLIDRKAHKESLSKQGRHKHKVFTEIVNQELDKIKLEGRMYDKLERASSAAQAQAAAAAVSQSQSISTGAQSFYGLPVSQSSTSIYSKRISRLIPSISSADVSSYLDGGNNGSSNSSYSAGGSSAQDSATSSGAGGKRPATHHHRKSRLGGFFKSVRPLSVLGGSSGLTSNSNNNNNNSNGSGNNHSNNIYAGGTGGTVYSSGSAMNNSSSSINYNINGGNHLSQLPNSSSNSMISSSLPSIGISGPTQITVPDVSGLYGQPNNSASSIVSFADDKPEDGPQNQHNPWVSDSTVDLNSQPAVSLYSADDWRQLLQVDVGNFNNVELRPPNFVVITHRSGPKPETLVLRGSSVESAREWCSQALHTMESKLMRSTKVFGVALNIVAQREHTLVPAFLETLLHEIEYRGLDEVGVYRISGSLAAVNGIKQWFDQGNTGVKVGDPRWSDINAIAGCIKLYLRELPQPLMTTELLPQFMATVNGVQGVNLEAFKAVLEKLPPPNYHTLKRISQHLRLVVDHSDENKMNMQNIAIVFSVNFLPPVAMAQMGGMQQLVTALVQQRDYLFPE